MASASPPYPPADPGTAPAPAPPPDDGRWILSYQDFVPNQLTAGEMFREPTYEPFSTVVVRANQWLQQNPAIKVKVCESIETKSEGYMVDTNRANFYESGKMSTFYVRSLRLWVVPKGAGDNPAPQQLGYLNVLPAQLSPGGFLSAAQFATYGETISRLNEMFQAQPLPGRIVNVETIDVKAAGQSSESMNPDQSFWRESGKYSTFFLNVIRVFYEAGPPCNEQIGTLDFVPSSISGYNQEPLSVLLQRVNAWIQQNPNLPVCNVQSLDFKAHHGAGGHVMDTQRSYYFESGNYSTAFIRILRVYYVTGTAYRQPVQAISYKTFVPATLSMSMFSAQYEGMSQCMARAMAWLKLTNAKVIGCETQAVRLRGMNAEAASSESTYYYESGKMANHFVFVIRVFLDGFYQEPPPELLPQPQAPAVQQGVDTNCCTLQ